MCDYIDHIDLWSDGLHSNVPPLVEASQVSLTFGELVGQAGLSLDIPSIDPGKASGDQELHYITSPSHLVSIWIRLTYVCEGTSDASSQGNSR